ncbi:hypothetical protein BGZ57DRAFT_897939, partial [Hyaloscypha finlandica]
MTLVLACELALACIPLINLYQFSQIESWVAIMVLAWITNECPSSSHAKAPFRLAVTTSGPVREMTSRHDLDLL